jgi:transposase
VPPVDRRNPTRARSSESSCSLMEFMREFPDDDACLQWLWRNRYAPDGEHAHCGRCEAERVFKRYETKDRNPAWFCQACGFRIRPLVGTIFARSSTSLHLWFYAIFLMTSTRCGISAKQLERELGVTYKTAWRMFNKIRNDLMTHEETPLSGPVEADETFIGGKPREGHYRIMREQGIEPRSPQSRAWHAARKQTVFGVVQRKGQVRAVVVPSSRAQVLRAKVGEYVLPSSIIYTDDYKGYDGIGFQRRYIHHRIPHHAKVYVDGDVHTQTIEGFFSLVKNGIRGVYHSVSAKWLQGYLNEYAWRYNHRDDDTPQFKTLLQRTTTR